MFEFKEAKKYIKKANKIYIVGHKNPDGDSIGASLSLCIALRKIGKDATAIIPKHSDVFDFMPYINESKTSIEEDKIDLLITVDSSDITNVALSEDDKKKAKNIIKFDHHEDSSLFATVNINEAECPAVCQVIYEFLKYMKIKIDIDIATCIYSGILTDTGSFNYSSTNARTLYIVSKLVGLGINFSSICKKLNDTIKESKLKLIATAINNMEVYENGKIRYTYIDYDTISKLDVPEEDADGLGNYLRMVEGTEVAVYVRGKSDGTNKVSMRANDKVDLSRVAILFGGGGHRKAAGYTMPESVEISKKKLLDELIKLV